MKKKIKLYPKFCEGENCNKGINEGWTNDHINICDSCFEKEEEWKADAKEQWDKHEKNNSYEPDTYRTAWNVEEFDWVFDKEGNHIDLSDLSKKEIKEKYRFMDGD
jgi:hypothetical protein